MSQQHSCESLLVSQQSLQSGLWNLGEGVIGWSKDGEGRGLLDGVDKVCGLDCGHQGGESWICSQNSHQVSGQGSEGSIGGGKDSEGSISSESFCQTSLDCQVYQGRSSIVGQFLHNVS